MHDAVLNLNVCLVRNLIVTVPDHSLSSTFRPVPYFSNALESWQFCPRHHIGKEHKQKDDIKQISSERVKSKSRVQAEKLTQSK